MKKAFIFGLILTGITATYAQNPFAEYGYEPKIATLSQGKYNEFFDQDTIVQIGQALFNTQSRKLVGFVEYDTLYSEATLEPDIVSRWLSPDPLAAEYTSWSPYSYVADNPIIFIDPDGREIKISHNTNTDKQGVVTSIDIHIQVTGKILNNAHGNVNTESVVNFVNSEVIRLFNDKTIAFENGIKWNISAESNITIAETMDDVKVSDHLIAIVDDVEGDGLLWDNIGIATLGGKIAYAEKCLNGGGCSGPKTDIDKIGRIAVHELLHDFGLDDMYNKPKEEQVPNNYMLGGALPENNQLTRDQMIDAIGGTHNLGNNYSFESDVKNKNWYDTSNSDPRLNKTKGSDGKIPAIVNE